MLSEIRDQALNLTVVAGRKADRDEVERICSTKTNKADTEVYLEAQQVQQRQLG